LYFTAYSIDAKATINIVGGYNVQIENFPYQIAILLDGNLLCGGSILTENYALTAAHCILETVGKKLIIHAGTTFWAQPGSIHHVDTSVTYGTAQNVDVAVLRVTEAFIFDTKHQPVK
jgi:trypsin